MSLALTKRWNMDHKVLCFALIYVGVQAAYGGEITDLTKLCSKIGFSGREVVKKTDLGREKGDRGGRDVCSENNNKVWEPVDLFLSFLRSKEKCTQFEL